MKRTGFIAAVLGPAVLVLAAAASAQVTKYVRYSHQGRTSFGILEGDQIRELDRSPIEGAKPTGKSVALSSVKLLAPVEPSKVIAVGLNYKSHIGNAEPSKTPPLFAKLPTCIIGTEAPIVYPEGASNVHFEGELVVVIGKKASRVSKEEAAQYVFGVTAGNDVSERDWQRDDLQWFRAKASDTFGPIGPVMATGLDYNDLLLQTRLNGKVLQKQRTSDLLFNVEDIVSFASQFVTLMPGDVIFTGTPGTTSAMKPGDVVEIELEGVGILRNTIATSSKSGTTSPNR
jgi:2-keto-4-pentenoate hydratase/2-oxohepta-3-ene-1,7-dioic acid hydratase in catechol pathway